MKTAWYMKFVPGHSGALDRVGGVPSHLPSEIPRCEDTGEEMAFLIQLYADNVRLSLSNTLCLQLYQCCGVDDGDDPHPVVVSVPIDAKDNMLGRGVRCPYVRQFAIEWNRTDDPDAIPLPRGYDPKHAQLYKSKLGGAVAFPDVLLESDVFLGQIAQAPVGFNFGEATVILLLRDGKVQLELV